MLIIRTVFRALLGGEMSFFNSEIITLVIINMLFLSVRARTLILSVLNSRKLLSSISGSLPQIRASIMSFPDLWEQYLRICIILASFKFSPLLFDNTSDVQSCVSFKERFGLRKLFIIFRQLLIRHSRLLANNPLSHF